MFSEAEAIAGTASWPGGVRSARNEVERKDTDKAPNQDIQKELSPRYSTDRR
jgi:hypothetical protein